MTSDSEMSATQTSSGSKVSLALQQPGGPKEQEKVSQSRDERSNNDMEFEEHRSAQGDNKESSEKNIKSSSEGENDIFSYFSIIQF